MINPSTQASANYFAAGDAIVERLKAALPDVKAVFTTASLADVEETSQKTPCIHIIYIGDNIPSTGGAGNGARKAVDQRWMVVLAVRNAKAQLQETSALREDAGALIPKILDALSGWAPLTYMRPLERVQAVPVAYRKTFAYFPFLFEGRLIT